MKKLIIVFIVIIMQIGCADFMHYTFYKHKTKRLSRDIRKDRSMLFTPLDRKLYKQYSKGWIGDRLVFKDTVAISLEAFVMYQGAMFEKRTGLLYHVLDDGVVFIDIGRYDVADSTSPFFLYEVQHPILDRIAKELK